MKIVFFCLRQPEAPSMAVHQLHATYSARHCCALSLCELVPPQLLAESFLYGLTDYFGKPLSGKPAYTVSQWILEKVGSHYRNPPPNTMIFYQSTVAFLATVNGNRARTAHFLATFLAPRTATDSVIGNHRNAAGVSLCFTLHHYYTRLEFLAGGNRCGRDRKTFDLRCRVTTQIFTVFSLHLFRRRCDLQALIG
jgi:hypothetical protein